MIWDEGVYTLASEQKNEEKYLKQALRKGHLDLVLCGSKLKGGFALIRMQLGDEKHWLLMKKKDEFASKKDVSLLDRSVKTGRSMEEITLGKKHPLTRL